jgi:hypothetical protein
MVVGWVLFGKRRQAAALRGSCFALLLTGVGQPIKCATDSAATKKTGRRCGDHARLRPGLVPRWVPLGCVDLSFATDK